MKQVFVPESFNVESGAEPTSNLRGGGGGGRLETKRAGDQEEF